MITGLDQLDLSRKNCAAALTLIQRNGGLSRMELAEQLSLSRSALTKISAKLLDSKAVSQAPVNGGTARDLPRWRLEINPEWTHVITVSMTYNLAVGVVNFAGKLVHQEHLVGDGFTHGLYRDNFDETICTAVKRLCREWRNKPILGVGVLSGGYVDPEGIVRHNGDLPRTDVDMRQVLASATNLPVHAGEEMRLLLQSKMLCGGLPQWNHVVLLNPGPIGCGGGHAQLIDNNIYYGKDGVPGLFGWRMGAPHEHTMGRKLELAIEKIGGMTAYLRELAAGRPEASAVLDQCIENYGYRLAQIVNYLNPEAVLLYGIYAEMGQSLLDRILAQARKYTEPSVLDGTAVMWAGKRSDEDRLVAAAVPVLSHVFTDGIMEPSVK